MTRVLLNGNAAAAWGARLAEADYVPAFPITPQTEIIELLAAWSESGEMPVRVTLLESEHSMVTAAAAAAATGVRVFSATSSQGLLYAMEMLFTVAGWRAPFVLVNVSRALASPVTLEPDHTDVFAARDCGFLQIHCATCQDVLDGVLMGYRITEDPHVRLPVIVNLDGFHLSFTRELVEIPPPAAVRGFLPPFDPGPLAFRASRPVSRAVAVLGGSPYSYFRYQSHQASLAALDVFAAAAAEFARSFGRAHPVVAAYRADDAEIVYFMVGSFATHAQAAVDRLRDAGERVGLIRPRLLRPYPTEAVRTALAGKRAVAVVDQNLSMGQGGVLCTELRAALHGVPNAPLVLSYVGGLGGREISIEEFVAMARESREAAASGRVPPPRLLFDASELRRIRALQSLALAGAEAE